MKNKTSPPTSVILAPVKILGIETSCDETAAAVVEDGVRLLSNVVHSQVDLFAFYGGVIPEVAARSHIESIIPVIDQALSDATCTWDDIDAIGVTYAPGLVGSLLIGTLTARTLAHTYRKPLYAVHHVEGHVYANYITHKADSPQPIADSERHTRQSAIDGLVLPRHVPQFPLLALIVSGGHSQLALFRDHGDYVLLGQTQDDAVGEAFDKVAKIIGLPYPGGVSISKLAPSGNPEAFSFPQASLKCPPGCTHEINTPASPADIEAGRAVKGGRGEWFLRSRCHKYDFSFSGLKTAVLRAVQDACGVDHTFASHELPARVSDGLRADVAASFQDAAVRTLVDKTLQAFADHSPASVVIAGGVAANAELRRQLQEALPIPIEYAPMSLCTDNAAMIASLAYYMAKYTDPVDPMTLEVVPSLSMTGTAWRPAAA